MENELFIVILRGISGVGKSIMRKLIDLVMTDIYKKKVYVINKDSYRHYLESTEGYNYTPAEEIKVSNWYRSEFDYATNTRNDFDVVICDNTHVRLEELKIPLMEDPRYRFIWKDKRRVRFVLLNIGSPQSYTVSSIPDEIIERMRRDMKESNVYVDKVAEAGKAMIIDIDEFDGVHQDIADLCAEILRYE